MLSVAEASRTVLANIRRLDAEEIPFTECAGRVLAEEISARVSMPPWDNSSMDGYAVRSGDVSQASEDRPVLLQVAGDIPAGAFATASVGPGQAMRIMTGAPVPAGADCIVRLEETDRGMTTVAIRARSADGRNIRYAGEDFQKGSPAIASNTPLNAAHVGLLAALGTATVRAYRRPRVAIISSGDELVQIDAYSEVIAEKKIVSSNNYTLAALVLQAGGIPVDLGIAADSISSLSQKLESALDCDIIITSAGVSAGEKDFTREAIDQLGGKQVFWKVKMRPGAPLAFGMLHEKPWLGVSGNPVSAMVSFILFAQPAIRKMLGHSLLFPSMVTATAQDEIVTTAPLTHFLRGILSRDDRGYSARLSGSQSSGVMTAMASANALLVIPENVQRVPIGSTLNAIPIHEDSFMTQTIGL